jgi:hypothetical protein
LHLILRRVRQRAFVLEDFAEITAVDPAIACRAPDEMVSLFLRGIAKRLADVPAVRDHPQTSSCTMIRLRWNSS